MLQVQGNVEGTLRLISLRHFNNIDDFRNQDMDYFAQVNWSLNALHSKKRGDKGDFQENVQGHGKDTGKNHKLAVLSQTVVVQHCWGHTSLLH